MLSFLIFQPFLSFLFYFSRMCLFLSKRQCKFFFHLVVEFFYCFFFFCSIHATLCRHIWHVVCRDSRFVGLSTCACCMSVFGMKGNRCARTTSRDIQLGNQLLLHCCHSSTVYYIFLLLPVFLFFSCPVPAAMECRAIALIYAE